MSRYGPCPISSQQTVHPPSRTPWSVHQCSDSRSSTTSSHSYHRIVPVAPFVPVDDCRYWDGGGGGGGHQGGIMLHGYLPPGQTAVYQQPSQAQPQQQQIFLDTALRQTPPSHNFNSASESGTGRRSYVPSPTEAVIVPCGGHCILLETFCHHFLKVVFVAGVLTGICLVVAGLVLGVRAGPGGLPPIRARGPDLSVLTYIGSMTSLVSGLLLSVQCCGRQRGRLQSKSLRSQPQPATSTAREEIPLRQLPPLQPLLTEIVHQQIAHQDHLREESGIPWWRREAASS
uniref:Putative conserved plasma membrane protein n=1 Tax=Panstrongylus lignarius TaxID=156445 RepID=A0A224XH83_9HEMI